MKKAHFPIAFVLSLLAMTQNFAQQSPCLAELSVSTPILNYLTSGGSQKFTIKSSGNWIITNLPTGISISPTTGTVGETTVMLNLPANTRGNSSFTLLINNSCKNANIVVYQATSPQCEHAYLTASETDILFPPLAVNKTITIKSEPKAWTQTAMPTGFFVPLSSPSASGSSNITIQASPNTGKYARGGFITFKNACYSLNVKLTQQAR